MLCPDVDPVHVAATLYIFILYVVLIIMAQEEEEAMDYVTKLASVLPIYKPEHVLVAEFLHEQYDPALVGGWLVAEVVGG